MFKSSFRLPFDLFGIPIRLDATFVLLIALLTWLIGGNVSTYVDLFELPIDAAPLQQGATPYLLGLLSAIGLMLSVLIHELSHALTARRYGVEIKEIRLWILGGIAQFREMPKQPRAEAVVAICDSLAERHGDRFAPPKLLREMARNGETFYGRFAPAEPAAA